MINFKCLEIQSFKSIFKATLDFDLMQGKFYQLEGKNETVNFASSNGSGKTTCLNALAFAIYGTTLDVYMKAEEYQNKNTSVPLTLSLVFGVQQGNNEEQLYTVIRTLKSVKLYKGEEDISELTKTATEKKLLSIINITKEEFFSFTYLTQYSGGNFLSKTASEKLAAIREFVFGEELLQIKTSIDSLLKTTNEQHKSISAEISKLSGSIESLLDILESEDSSTESAVKNKEEYESNKRKIQDLRDKITNINQKKYTKQSLQNSMDNLKRQMQSLKKQLDSVKENKCPTCGQTLKDNKTEELESSIRKEAKEIKDKAKTIKADLASIEAELEHTSIDDLQRDVDILTKMNAEYVSSVKLMERQEYAKSNIDKLQQTVKNLTTEYDKLDDKIKTIKDLQKYFNTKFVQEVQQTFLSEIENYLNLYCYDLFNDSFELKFTGTNLELLIGGKPYSYFSGGERQKIDFLFVFAVKFILSSFTDKCTNLFLADEALSAQDYCSFENCIDLIDRLSESSGLTVILVSHRETSNTIRNKIMLTRYEDKTELEILTV